MNYEEFKKIMDNIHTHDEYEEVIQRIDITPEELSSFNERYNKQFESILKEMHKKERKYMIVVGVIFLALIFLFFYYSALNGIDVEEYPGLLYFAILIIGGIVVMCIISWKIQKKYMDQIHNKPFNPQ